MPKRVEEKRGAEGLAAPPWYIEFLNSQAWAGRLACHCPRAGTQASLGGKQGKPSSWRGEVRVGREVGLEQRMEGKDVRLLLRGHTEKADLRLFGSLALSLLGLHNYLPTFRQSSWVASSVTTLVSLP